MNVVLYGPFTPTTARRSEETPPDNPRIAAAASQESSIAFSSAP